MPAGFSLTSSPNLLAPSVHPSAPHITSHHLHIPLFYFCYTSLNCPPYAELGCLRAFAQTLSIARGALSTTVRLVYIHSFSQSPLRSGPSSKMPFPAPGTRLSLSLCSPAPGGFSSPALITVCDCTLYLYHCLPPERAMVKSMDSGIRLHGLQRSLPLHQLCGLGQVPTSSVLLICATKPVK